MAFNDRLIPIKTNVNDIPSSPGTDFHPNASLLIDKYNRLLTNVLPAIVLGEDPNQNSSYIVRREIYPYSSTGITLVLDTSLQSSSEFTFHTVSKLVDFLNNKIFSQPIDLIINNNVNFGTFIINSLFVNPDDRLRISKTNLDINMCFTYLSSSLRISFINFFENIRPSYEDPLYGPQPSAYLTFHCSNTDIIFELGCKIDQPHNYYECTLLFLAGILTVTNIYFFSIIKATASQITFQSLNDSESSESYFPQLYATGNSTIIFNNCTLDVSKSLPMDIYSGRLLINNSTFIKAGNSLNSTWRITCNNCFMLIHNSIFRRVNLLNFTVGSVSNFCVAFFKNCTGGYDLSNKFIFVTNVEDE